MKRCFALIGSLGVVVLLAGAGGVSAAEQENACKTLSKMREGYRSMNTAMAKKRTRKVSEEKEEFDAEETGCFGDWGTNLGLGLPGLADSFFNDLKNSACSAMNDYVNKQLDSLDSSISGPLDLVGIEAGFGGDKPFNLSTKDNDIKLDTGGIIDDVLKDAPDLGDDYGVGGVKDKVGEDWLDGKDLEDGYLDSDRGKSVPVPNWNPSAGGRGGK